MGKAVNKLLKEIKKYLPPGAQRRRGFRCFDGRGVAAA